MGIGRVTCRECFVWYLLDCLGPEGVEMSSLQSGLRYGSKRLLRILRPQQHVSPASCTGGHTAATWEWRRQEAELSRRREQQDREFLTVADSKVT